MKRRVLYALLIAVAIVGGVTLARSGPQPSVTVGSRAPTPAFVMVDGYRCPVGQGVGETFVDGWEHRPMVSAQRAVAVTVANSPALSFDAEARVDLDKSAREAAFAFRDPDGHLLARIRAERVMGGWVLAGWTSCGGLEQFHTPAPEPSVVPTQTTATSLGQHDGGDAMDGNVGKSRSAHPPSIARELTVIARGADVPAVLPDEVAQSFQPAERHPLYPPAHEDGTKEWILHLVRGRRDSLLVSYGDVHFDGCDVPHARRINISGTPGLLALSRRNGHVIWSQLIWPANHAHPVGRYGLSGSLPTHRLMEMARSMPRVQPSWLLPGGC